MKQQLQRKNNRWASACTVGLVCGTLITYLRRKAKERNLEWDIDATYLWDLFQQQEGKCALSGIPITLTTKINSQNNLDRKYMTASLDRIDTSLGYIDGNVQWTHKLVNIMRQSMTIEEFVYWCKLVVEHNKDLYDI